MIFGYTSVPILAVLLLIQAFLAGMEFNAEWGWARTWSDKIIAVGKAAIIALAVVPIWTILLIAWPFWKAGEYIWKNLSVGFIVKYMIRRMPFRAIPCRIHKVRERFYTQSPKWYQLRKRLNNFVVLWAEANYTPVED